MTMINDGFDVHMFEISEGYPRNQMRLRRFRDGERRAACVVTNL